MKTFEYSFFFCKDNSTHIWKKVEKNKCKCNSLIELIEEWGNESKIKGYNSCSCLVQCAKYHGRVQSMNETCCRKYKEQRQPLFTFALAIQHHIRLIVNHVLNFTFYMCHTVNTSSMQNYFSFFLHPSIRHSTDLFLSIIRVTAEPNNMKSKPWFAQQKTKLNFMILFLFFIKMCHLSP